MGAASGIRVPHLLQKTASAVFSCPQLTQTLAAEPIGLGAYRMMFRDRMNEPSRIRYVPLVLAAALFVGCDPAVTTDSGTDSGRPDVAIPDTAVQDTSVEDSGPPPGFSVRLVHNIPG